jgi:hypothetical protein
VSNPVPSRKGCEVAYSVARLDPVAGVFSTLDLLLAYGPELFREYSSQNHTAVGASAE